MKKIFLWVLVIGLTNMIFFMFFYTITTSFEVIETDNANFSILNSLPENDDIFKNGGISHNNVSPQFYKNYNQLKYYDKQKENKNKYYNHSSYSVSHKRSILENINHFLLDIWNSLISCN